LKVTVSPTEGVGGSQIMTALIHARAWGVNAATMMIVVIKKRKIRELSLFTLSLPSLFVQHHKIALKQYLNFSGLLETADPAILGPRTWFIRVLFRFSSVIFNNNNLIRGLFIIMNLYKTNMESGKEN
jgi:hypothetical protein